MDGFSEFLSVSWPRLQEMDLSRCRDVLKPRVLEAIADERYLPSLRKLTLQLVTLQDPAVKILASGMGTRLRELDVTGNMVTDVGVGYLLDYCFLPPDYTPDGFWGEYAIESNMGPGQRGGLSRLMIAHNKVSWKSVESLVRTTRLEVLDVGIIDDVNEEDLYFSSRRRLSIPVLPAYAYKNLRSLRIDSRIIANDERIDPVLRLKPQMFPSLKKLVLCGVPSACITSFITIAPLGTSGSG